MAVDPFLPTDEIISNDYIDSFVSANWIKIDRTSPKELKIIRRWIAETRRPTWHRGPPVDLGSPSARKVKAEQWRGSVEFDLVVATAKLYSPQKCLLTDPAERARREKLFKATMLLAMAILWASSDRTSVIHYIKYMSYMQAYQRVLLELFPDRNLLPNHHAALHVGFFLLYFGPTRGWWMFPFERLIGRLQKFNTNGKLRE